MWVRSIWMEKAFAKRFFSFSNSIDEYFRNMIYLTSRIWLSFYSLSIFTKSEIKINWKYLSRVAFHPLSIASKKVEIAASTLKKMNDIAKDTNVSYSKWEKQKRKKNNQNRTWVIWHRAALTNHNIVCIKKNDKHNC